MMNHPPKFVFGLGAFHQSDNSPVGKEFIKFRRKNESS